MSDRFAYAVAGIGMGSLAGVLGVFAVVGADRLTVLQGWLLAMLAVVAMAGLYQVSMEVED